MHFKPLDMQDHTLRRLLWTGLLSAVVYTGVQGCDSASRLQSADGSLGQGEPDLSKRRESAVWYDIVQMVPDGSQSVSPKVFAALKATGLPWKVRDRKTMIEFVLIPNAGRQHRTIELGEDRNWNREHVQMEVDLESPFYFGATEVTVAQMDRMSIDRPARLELAGLDPQVHPASNYRIQDVLPQFHAYGFRIPNDLEWHYAAALILSQPTESVLRHSNTRPLTIRETNKELDKGRVLAVAALGESGWGISDLFGNLHEVTYQGRACDSLLGKAWARHRWAGVFGTDPRWFAQGGSYIWLPSDCFRLSLGATLFESVHFIGYRLARDA